MSSHSIQITRIGNQTIEKSKDGKKTLFMLDEILKGTNSNDRHEGAQALIHQLVNLKTTGFISTHDLELTNLESSMNGNLKNYSFTSEFEAGKLSFDYKIKNGPCQSFNAVQLMKSIGIEMDWLSLWTNGKIILQRF